MGEDGYSALGVVLTASGGSQNNQPRSRLWQSAPPIAVVRLRRLSHRSMVLMPKLI